MSDGTADAFVGLVIATIILFAFDPIISSLLAQDAVSATGFSGTEAVLQLSSTLFHSHIDIIVAWVGFFGAMFTSKGRN